MPNLEMAVTMMAKQLKIVIENMNCLTTAATPLTLTSADRILGDTPMSEPHTKTQRPKPAIPPDSDGDWNKGLTFIHSYQTYIHLCPEEFQDKQTKVVWAMSYMKSR